MTAKFIDVQHLKQPVKIEEVVELLGLTLKQYGTQRRGPCPACKSGGDRTLIVTPTKGTFYCFATKLGGDVIGLASHIYGIGMKEAAQLIAEKSHSRPKSHSPTAKPTVSSTVPEKEKAGFNLLTYLQA
ncbi:MAG: CHC2 zinc finger domain-containing protein [Aestuariivirga sp.]